MNPQLQKSFPASHYEQGQWVFPTKSVEPVRSNRPRLDVAGHLREPSSVGAATGGAMRMVHSPYPLPIYPASPSPTPAKITARTSQLTATPASTRPAALKYLHFNRILRASKFCTATIADTPVRTQSIPRPAEGDKKPVAKPIEEEFKVAADGAGGSADDEADESSYFQTTIRIGNRDMQEETTRAVDMALGVAGLGGATCVGGSVPGVAAPAPPPPSL